MNWIETKQNDRNTAIGVSIGFEVTHPPPLNQTMTISLSNLRLDVVNDKSGGKSDFLLKFGAHFTEGLLTPPIPLMSGSDRRSSAVDQKRASQKKDPILRVTFLRIGFYYYNNFLTDLGCTWTIWIWNIFVRWELFETSFPKGWIVDKGRRKRILFDWSRNDCSSSWI